MHALAAACLIVFCTAARAPEKKATPSRAVRGLDRRWQRIDGARPRYSTRELFNFALEAVDRGLWPERIERAFELAEQLQDRDPSSRTFGNFKWYHDSDQPRDRNAVEFCMQRGVLIWMFYKDKLTTGARERLERLIRFSVEGMRRHRVRESYTNIFVMKTWNAIAIGEHTSRPELAEEGYQMLDRWLLDVWEQGVHEYISPTYTGVDMESLALIARHAKREAGRQAAEAALRLFWTDIAANWYEPGKRLGGAHSRDYDYLTGHGHTDVQLRLAGWLDGRPPTVFERLMYVAPPAGVCEAVQAIVPRTVHQRWGRRPGERAVHYVGRRFSIGSSGATYGPMDKPLTVNLPGGPKMPVVNVFMDARGDPYGKRRFAVGGGHSKALHLTPFLASVQRGPETLMCVSGDPSRGWFARHADQATCLLTHVVLPMDVELWLGERKTEIPKAGAKLGVPAGTAVFIRLGDVAVGVRLPWTLGSDGRPAPVELAADGRKWRAMRLTCVHAAAKPNAPGKAVVWVRAAEGLDDAGFATFRRAFADAECGVSVEGERIRVRAAGLERELVVDAVPAAGRRATEGDVTGAEEFLLAVNGRDLGRAILGQVPVIARYRRLLAQAEEGADGAPVAGQPVEAEAAAFVVPPFRVDTHATASGGKCMWMPGEPGAKGGSGIARALWLVRVPEDGTYTLWGRVLAPTPDDDSFFVRVRQGRTDVLPRSGWHTGVHADWQWAAVRDGRSPAPADLNLTQGVAIIEFMCRENGTRLDAIQLQKADSPPPGAGR